MTVIDRGTGTPLIVVPGIQGRWEWHRPAIDALAQRCRVITFSLADERGTGASFSGESCLESYVEQIAAVMAERSLTSVALCGISYGGLVAATFAARHPERVTALALASALSPRWRPERRVSVFLRAPRLCTPLFLLSSLRLLTEIRAAAPSFDVAARTALVHGWNVATHRFSPVRMARRAAQVKTCGLEADIAGSSTPTLIIVGERHLDRVVPVDTTLQYAQLLPQAQVMVLDRTGHLGAITRPNAFADLVAAFAHRHAQSIPSRRRLG